MNTLVSHFRSILKNKESRKRYSALFSFENKYLILHMNFSLSFPFHDMQKVGKIEPWCAVLLLKHSWV